ncbi:MAG: peptidase family protein [Clostridia bacterium]|nr:peptidase family protein [Clostridia bacterium]
MKNQKFFNTEHKLKNGLLNTFIIQLLISSILLLSLLITINFDPFVINKIKKNIGNNKDNLQGLSSQILKFIDNENNDNNDNDNNIPDNQNKSGSDNPVDSYDSEKSLNNAAAVMSDAKDILDELPENMPNDLKTFLQNIHFEMMTGIEEYPLFDNETAPSGGIFYSNYTDYLLNTRKLDTDEITPTEIAVASFNKYTLPVNGKITSDFGYRKDPFTKLSVFHNGLDIAVESGEEVMSVLSGTVIKTGYSNVGGNYLYIQHDNGFLSYYGHLKKIIKKNGDIVQNGELIALSGNTGLTTGPHLHFQLMYNDRPIDPKVYMNFD